MKAVVYFVAYSFLALMFVAALLRAADRIGSETANLILLISTAGWFAVLSCRRSIVEALSAEDEK